MKYLQNNWQPLLVISVFLGLIIYFQSFLTTNIFEPIAVLFWALWRMICSVHQNYYWTILILVCSILLIRSIPFRGNSASLAYREEQCPPSRVEDWQRQLKNASDGTSQTEYLRDSLKDLLNSIYLVEQSHTMKVEEAVLPETVRCFLFPAKKKHSDRLQILLFMPKWFRRSVSKVFQTDNTGIEETLAWMESTMEISNDQ